ncbi:aminoacyl-tRNA hydrolase [Faecalibacter rhinopitheci]|uniref:Peptidyl-tRNA hydrolase n=1 Tax=Faecalibacter rhinopitheci TaxID=2779678 RepID=A0A8J7FS14_9FLAO|nr:aminoacyl-tRNA hydrolase [Faecalibacter rhinopitheci]MBF0597598.1 aminoacyl-tRNA hydrolase [Faecalibacter rhinopitheci]MBQ0148612.1 aminoacyl-tRNA hydrolase [Candidatus Onthonaster equi]
MQKFLIIGLGNIGDKYEHTRHNIGFKIVDRVAEKVNVNFGSSNFGQIAQFKFKGRPVTLLKPNTYMNLSGDAVKFWLKKENISPENIFVITDDLNLPFGSIRIRSKGSDGGHNGLKDIQNKIQTQAYPRLRFGVGNEFLKGQQADYVLGGWTAEEEQLLNERLNHCADAALSFVFAGLNNTMNQYNGK